MWTPRVAPGQQTPVVCRVACPCRTQSTPNERSQPLSRDPRRHLRTASAPCPSRSRAQRQPQPQPQPQRQSQRTSPRRCPGGSVRTSRRRRRDEPRHTRRVRPRLPGRSPRWLRTQPPPLRRPPTPTSRDATSPRPATRPSLATPTRRTRPLRPLRRGPGHARGRHCQPNRRRWPMSTRAPGRPRRRCRCRCSTSSVRLRSWLPGAPPVRPTPTRRSPIRPTRGRPTRGRPARGQPARGRPVRPGAPAQPPHRPRAGPCAACAAPSVPAWPRSWLGWARPDLACAGCGEGPR